jgi:hypothetical protein
MFFVFRLCLSNYLMIASSTLRCRYVNLYVARTRETILQQLTSGLEIISTFQLHLFTNVESGVLLIEYRNPSSNVTPGHIPITEVFVTDLAFQAMALGKESMAGHHCRGDRHGQHSWQAMAVGLLGRASSSLGLPQKVFPCSSAQTAQTGGRLQTSCRGRGPL